MQSFVLPPALIGSVSQVAFCAEIRPREEEVARSKEPKPEVTGNTETLVLPEHDSHRCVLHLFENVVVVCDIDH